MAAKADEGALLLKLIGWRWALLASLLCVVVAGVAGAIVATSTIESTRYTDFLRNKQGAYGLRPFIGKTWVTIEHGAFWLSLVFLGVVVFSADSVPSWLFYRTTLEQSLVTGL
jgi:hypothetical protein